MEVSDSEVMAVKFLPSASVPFPLLFYLLIVTVFICMGNF